MVSDLRDLCQNLGLWPIFSLIFSSTLLSGSEPGIEALPPCSSCCSMAHLPSHDVSVTVVDPCSVASLNAGGVTSSASGLSACDFICPSPSESLLLSVTVPSYNLSFCCSKGSRQNRVSG